VVNTRGLADMARTLAASMGRKDAA
jgi:hypothetical protein